MLRYEEPYQAPAPRVSTGHKVANVLKWIFPPTAIWRLMKMGMDKLAGARCSKLVLPAQNHVGLARQAVISRAAFLQKLETENLSSQGDSRLPPINVTQRYVHTHDGARLHTMELKPIDESLPDQERIHIINMFGNMDVYETFLADMREDANELNANVIGFNWRTVAGSKGLNAPAANNDENSANDAERNNGDAPRKAELLTDGIAQVQRLLDRGVPPEKIFLKSHSLGAALATGVATHFHAHNIKINVMNAASFSSITNYLVGHIRTLGTDNGHQAGLSAPRRFFNSLLGYIVKPIIKFALHLVGWEINAASQWKSLPASHKEYFVIRSNKTARAEGACDDAVIPHYGSLHRACKSERREQKNNFAMAESALRIASTGSELSDIHIRRSLKNLEVARDKMRERKMTTAEDRQTQDAHSFPHNELWDRYKVHTAQRFFYKFVRHASEHHARVEEAARPSVDLRAYVP